MKLGDRIRRADHVFEQRDMLHDAEEDYLGRAGWRRTCSTPGSVWRWERTIEGRVFVLDHNGALYAQQYLDQFGSESLRAPGGCGS